MIIRLYSINFIDLLNNKFYGTYNRAAISGKCGRFYVQGNEGTGILIPGMLKVIYCT